jgi:hypothetical protein
MKTKTERETKGKRKNPIATKPLPVVEHAPLHWLRHILAYRLRWRSVLLAIVLGHTRLQNSMKDPDTLIRVWHTSAYFTDLLIF